jgi:polar amino acid transport system substrate-binding protein
MSGNNKSTIKLIFLILLGLLQFYCPIAAIAAPSENIGLTEKEINWLDEHPIIKVGIMNAWPPMDFVDDTGKPQGIGTGFIQALNKRLGDRLIIKPGPWDEVYSAAKEKQLDALMDITPRPDREKFFHFTQPYIEVPHLIFTKKYESYKSSLQELTDKKVAIEKGFFLNEVLRKKYPKIKVKEFNNTSNALQALANGEVDAYVGNRAVAMYIIKSELIADVAPAGKISESSSINAIGVRKDWPILRWTVYPPMNANR